MDVISINGLRLTAHHGVFDQERRVGNEFEVNVKLHVAAAYHVMMSDDINDAVNYAEVVEIVKKEMAIPSKLIENAAGRIRNALRERFGKQICGGEVTVAKLAPPIPGQLASVSFTTSW